MNQKNILIFLIPTFIVIVAWISFNIYHSSIDSTIPKDLSIQIAPISNEFDQKIIEALEKRTKVSPEFGITILQSSEPASLETQNATSSSSIELLPTATQDATSEGTLAP